MHRNNGNAYRQDALEDSYENAPLSTTEIDGAFLRCYTGDMSKKPKASGKRTTPPVTARTKSVAQTPGAPLHADFDVVLSLIDGARARAFIA
jgi:hypothetical protein